MKRYTKIHWIFLRQGKKCYRQKKKKTKNLKTKKNKKQNKNNKTNHGSGLGRR